MENSRINGGFVIHKVKEALFIASPAEDAKKLRVQENINEAIIVGLKSTAFFGGSAAVLMLVAARKVPWVKANINHVGKTFVISSACVASFIISAEKHLEKRIADDRWEGTRSRRSE